MSLGQVVYSPNYKAFVTLFSDVDKQALPVQSEEYADLMGTLLLSAVTFLIFVFLPLCLFVYTIYDTIGEFNVDLKAEYSALSSTRSQKKKLKQRQCPFNTVQVKIREVSPEGIRVTMEERICERDEF